MKPIKLSNTSVNLYKQCSYCWFLHYKENIRPVKTSSALVFGSALDAALNKLLLTKNFTKAVVVFEKEWNKYIEDENINYFKNDLDEKLLEHFPFMGSDKGLAKKEWDSLLIKGQMLLEAYYQEILPKIKEVIAVQEPITVKNSTGDEIVGFLDLIVEWEDGKRYLLDNKSSSRKYEENSAKEGQQLPLYYFAVKNKYKLDGIGYIVLLKKIDMNKTKTCKNCGIINNGAHKKCNETVEIGITEGDKYGRCNGEFIVTSNPKVKIQYIFNEVDKEDVNRVLETFDEVNNAISNELFNFEHNPVRGKYGWCPYKDYFEGSQDFIKGVEK